MSNEKYENKYSSGYLGNSWDFDCSTKKTDPVEDGQTSFKAVIVLAALGMVAAFCLGKSCSADKAPSVEKETKTLQQSNNMPKNGTKVVSINGVEYQRLVAAVQGMRSKTNV